jgi:hypothetical protein
MDLAGGAFFAIKLGLRPVYETVRKRSKVFIGNRVGFSMNGGRI